MEGKANLFGEVRSNGKRAGGGFQRVCYTSSERAAERGQRPTKKGETFAKTLTM